VRDRMSEMNEVAYTKRNLKKKPVRECVICGGRRHVLRKLNICRRCFKDHAPLLGFKKYN
jgi:ribosomal protein S14